jgi:hypothetical protein
MTPPAIHATRAELEHLAGIIDRAIQTGHGHGTILTSAGTLTLRLQLAR